MEGIRYEFDQRPEEGKTLALDDGLTWFRMPLPMQLNHINLWLLRDDDGWVIVDTGIDTKTSRRVWRDVFADAMEGKPATHVIVTHLHPDHAGCANFLVEEFEISVKLLLITQLPL